ncbi:MAG: hypothetical protein FJX35_06305 [Alphaproteobacteria bacterium]|nr:hypothetical protein [Alphaproteobacteria bacterium]
MTARDPDASRRGAEDVPASWSDLERELDAWAAAGRRATFWWRDDDAVEPSVELDRLIDLAGTARVVPALAVIPAHASGALADRLRSAPGSGSPCAVLQHGYAHHNHAVGTKSELGSERPLSIRLDELRRGEMRLKKLFGACAMPVLVPPWNRIAGDLLPALPSIGFVGISVYRARRSAQAAPGLRIANTHVDIVDWRGGRKFVGAGAALGLAVGHLAARRTGMADGAEPTGLLTHHLVHDEPCWNFMRRLLDETRKHPAAHWLAPPDVFEVHA